MERLKRLFHAAAIAIGAYIAAFQFLDGNASKAAAVGVGVSVVAIATVNELVRQLTEPDVEESEPKKPAVKTNPRYDMHGQPKDLG